MHSQIRFAHTQTHTCIDLVNTVVLEPLLVKLIWAEGVLPKNFSIDREGLRDITERHLLDSLTGSLGPNLIASVDILLSSDYTSDDTSWTEVFTGTVTRTEGSGIPSFTILGLVEEAIQGENLEIYEFRLKVSEYSRFRVVQSVQITTLSGGGGGGNNDESVEEDEEDRKWSKQLLILVCASGSLGLVAACSLLYCVYYCATQRATRLAEEKAKAAIATSGTELYIPSSSYKSSVASGSKQSNKSKISIQNIPLVKDTAKALGDALPRDEERSTSDDDNTMSLISMSAFGDDENPKYQFKPSHRSLPKDYAATAGLGGGLEKHRDEEGQEVMMMAQNTMLGAHFDADEDSHSVGTSVYSYFNQTGMDNQSVTTNDDTFLGSIIRRGTGLHDDDSVSRSSPPLYRPNPFSVMDTITKFVVSPRRKSSSSAKSSSVDIKMDGRGVEPSERITAINILPSSGSDFNGSITDYEDNETYAYGDVENPNHFESMYHEGQDGLTSFSHHANETASSNDDVADSGSEVGTMTSFYTNTDGPDVPVKERLESMWASEDAAYAAVELQQPQEDVKEPVVVKEVEEKEIEVENEGTGRIKVFQDDGSDRNSGSANAQGLLTSYESDDSPPVSILQQSKPVVPAPIPTMKIVNVTPTDAMCDESVGDDEDNGMALRLPNQLKGADLHHDNMSQSSSISSRSGRSSRSAAALRNNVFGAASLKAQANALLQKQQGMKQNDGEDGSVKSSDSALYRSLLSQDDTNDAGLFAKTPTNEGRRIPSSVRPKPQLSNLIRSFDQVWAKEEKSGIEQPKPVERERNDVDSDEDDLYLEGNEDGSEEDAYQSDNDSVKSGASRAVQQLSSMLSMPVVSVLDMKNEAVEKDPSPTKVMDVPIERFDLERKRSFEIQDPDEDEEEDAGGLDISRDTQDSETSVAMGMERLRRLSLGGYAETMASF